MYNMPVRRNTIFVLILIIIIMLIVRFGYKPISGVLGLNPKAGVRVETNVPAKVFIKGKEVGSTPFQKNDLSAGEYLIEIKAEGDLPEDRVTNAETLTWKKTVNLYPGTLTVVHRELGNDYPSGEVITLEKGQGVTIVSAPSEAEISVNGQVKGITPLYLTDITSGDYQFLIGKDNYYKRSIKATLVEGYNLTLIVDLASTEVGMGLASVPTSAPSVTPTPSPSSVVSPSPQKVSQVTVSNTPNGFLRVRKGPATTSAEITRVNEGTVLIVIGEQGGWYNVRLSNGTEGYVSAEYAKP
jgi:hypothetical protein